MLTFGHAVILMLLLTLAWVIASIRDARRKQQVYQRSAWFAGLLDSEAGELVEPQDWDDEIHPGYWRDYARGAMDYRRHMEERLP